MLPLYYSMYGNRAYVAGIIAVALLAVGVLVGYDELVRSAGNAGAAAAVTQVAKGAVYLSSGGKAASVAVAPAPPPMMELHIANDGLMLLRGALVQSVSGNTIRVVMEWGSSLFTWDVVTQYNTQYFGASGEKVTFTDIKVGDTVTVTGSLNTGGSVPKIVAKYVRE